MSGADVAWNQHRASRARELYRVRRRRGQCTRCRRPAKRGRAMCETHLEKARQYMAVLAPWREDDSGT